MELEELSNWVDIIDDFFEIVCVPLEEQASLVSFRFKGYAKFWWGQLQRDRKSLGKFPILSSGKIKRELLARFYVSRIERPSERAHCHGIRNSEVFLEGVEVEKKVVSKEDDLAENIVVLEASGVCEQPTLLVVRSRAINEEQPLEAPKEVIILEVAVRKEDQLAVQIFCKDEEAFA